jgi:hypothetical protein
MTGAVSVVVVAHDRGAQSALYERVDLARLRVPVQGVLREDHLAIEADLKAATTAGPKCDPLDHMGPAFEELGRQTGGSWAVVSDDAELDLELVLWRQAGRHCFSVVGPSSVSA